MPHERPVTTDRSGTDVRARIEGGPHDGEAVLVRHDMRTLQTVTIKRQVYRFINGIPHPKLVWEKS